VQTSVACFAQKELNMPDHDNKPYYFGITLSFNQSRFLANHHPYFLVQDTVAVAEPANGRGFSLGLAATVNLTPRFELRFNPQLIFTDKLMFYRLNKPSAAKDELPEMTKKIESILLHFPLHIKFNSDRIGNFRVYLLAGGKFDYDLNSNARAKRAEDLIKITKYDYGVEGGIGFNFYFESFIFSPEIKFSQGLQNLHSRDPNLKFSNVLDKLNSRMIIFSIHLEG
jgi:hypothetical protein